MKDWVLCMLVDEFGVLRKGGKGGSLALASQKSEFFFAMRCPG